MDNKTDLRANAKNLRKTLEIEAISQRLVEKIRQCPQYKQAQHVMLFYPCKYEVNLLALIDDDKSFYFPRVAGQNMFVCPYKVGDKLEKSCFNIQEPCSEPVSAHILDLVIVPALMADKSGYRLGYGGGFYDRFLTENNNVVTICAVPEQLYVDKLPCDSFDVPVDIVLKS